MKMTKKSLKKLIKECLIEIFAEDFIEGAVKKTLEESTMNLNGSRKPLAEQDLSREFLSKYRTDRPEIKTDITTSSVLNEALADTAKTTLPEMLREEAKMGGGFSSAETNDSGLVSADIDGDSQWEKVAFAPSTRRLGN
jgi:hypothetical protein